MPAMYFHWGEEYRDLTIAETGNFAYAAKENWMTGFWGFRDLVFGGTRAVSRYIMVESHPIVDGVPYDVPRQEVDVCEYKL